MNKEEAIKFFELQTQDEQALIDGINLNPDDFVFGAEGPEQYINDCQNNIDAYETAILALRRDGNKEEREMTQEERLLREIFTKSEQDEMPDNYPATHLDKADYAMHCMHKSLESISPALGRISRLCGLLRVSEKDGKNTLPDIITHNESRMALKHLAMVKRDVDEAYQEILTIFESTKEPGTVSKTEMVEQGPESGAEVEE